MSIVSHYFLPIMGFMGSVAEEAFIFCSLDVLIPCSEAKRIAVKAFAQIETNGIRKERGLDYEASELGIPNRSFLNNF